MSEKAALTSKVRGKAERIILCLQWALKLSTKIGEKWGKVMEYAADTRLAWSDFF